MVNVGGCTTNESQPVQLAYRYAKLLQGDHERLSEQCCIVNGGSGSWAFEPLARRLSSALGIEVTSVPRGFNYILCVEDAECLNRCKSFIPIKSIRIASDKRLIAAAFAAQQVPTPITRLVASFEEVHTLVAENPAIEWCLKYPTSCGASGHRLVSASMQEPANWPRPFIVQEFIHLEQPEVYRTYCAGGELFGWVARRFPEGIRSSPWVAHARGARYVNLGELPALAVDVARAALVATGLYDSFGCVDLLCRPTGEWVALEVGTDGIFNHVDRDLDNLELEADMDQRIANAFWRAAMRSHDFSRLV